MTNEVLNYCANESCNAPIHFGQAVFKVGHELVCSGKCLVAKLGAKTVTAGKEEPEGNE
ncbi:hypothetical protein FHR92_003461 [Fontibacillus solani]|uniref:Uncharacterized protein n=1 Tax=Fontibacillus solani TaxID=1572857 RepID=A0A7W3SVF6_9BACL|nr:hypothetical protein [Fontibacillus solani]MBA9086981.1 hypothetical protein [Fontibacillus solani]